MQGVSIKTKEECKRNSIFIKSSLCGSSDLIYKMEKD